MDIQTLYAENITRVSPFDIPSMHLESTTYILPLATSEWYRSFGYTFENINTPEINKMTHPFRKLIAKLEYMANQTMNYE